jgi:hypothetical protein
MTKKRKDKPEVDLSKPDLRGKMPESWNCIDCGINTAPGMLNREQMEQAFALDWEGNGIQQVFNDLTEVYTVKPEVWKAAGMETMGGCLCIGCLEKRIGRTLVQDDFPKHEFNEMPGTKRLLARRGEIEAVCCKCGKALWLKLRKPNKDGAVLPPEEIAKVTCSACNVAAQVDA